MGYKVEFEMDESTKSPTFENLDWCTKADLFLIVSFFDISVPLNARKAEINIILSKKLVEKGEWLLYQGLRPDHQTT